MLSQKTMAEKLKNLKATMDNAKAEFDKIKDDYIKLYGLGTYESNNFKLTIAEQNRTTTDYKAIAEKYVDNLGDLLGDYTKESKSTICRITAKLVK